MALLGRFRPGRRGQSDDCPPTWRADEASEAVEDAPEPCWRGPRLRPRTVTGWVLLTFSLSWVLLAVALALLVVFWPALWYVLAALFSLFGAIVSILFLAFVVYALARSKNLMAVFRESKAEDGASSPIPGEA